MGIEIIEIIRVSRSLELNNQAQPLNQRAFWNAPHKNDTANRRQKHDTRTKLLDGMGYSFFDSDLYGITGARGNPSGCNSTNSMIHPSSNAAKISRKPFFSGSVGREGREGRGGSLSNSVVTFGYSPHLPHPPHSSSVQGLNLNLVAFR